MRHFERVREQASQLIRSLRSKHEKSIEPVYDEQGRAWRGMIGDAAVEHYFGRIEGLDKPLGKVILTSGERSDLMGLNGRKMLGDQNEKS